MNRGIDTVMDALLKYKIIKLSESQAHIALFAILEGKEMKEAIEIAETYK